MKKVYIKLAGGIGNIIQSIPFALHMKNKGYRVIGINQAVDFSESLQLLTGVYDDIIGRDAAIEFSSNTFGPFGLRYNPLKTPEWAGYFVSYHTPIPEKVECRTNSRRVDTQFDVCICPTCKDNWPMKKYPHWNELAKMIASKRYSVGVIGQLKDGKDIDYGNGIYDARGFDLLQVAHILHNSKFVVANEGGLAHLSAAQGTKTFILMGGSHPVKNTPPNNSILISSNISCQPCQLNCAYVDKNVEPPIFYGCHPEVLKHHGSVDCLNCLTPETVMCKILEEIQ